MQRFAIPALAAALSAAVVAAPALSQDGDEPPGPARGALVAGVVESFDAGKLTVKLKNGETVSGRVTRRTHITCRIATAADAAQREQENGRPAAPQGERPEGERPEPTQGERPEGDRPEDAPRRQRRPRRCGTRALTAGTPVIRGTVGLTPRGARWASVGLLIRAQPEAGEAS